MNKRFEEIIKNCQELRKKYDIDYETKCTLDIYYYSIEIIQDKLIAKCSSNEQHFAKQLCMANSLSFELKESLYEIMELQLLEKELTKTKNEFEDVQYRISTILAFPRSSAA